jgi:dTDP-4-amino-4,6-dideoxygalactose transaminase
MSIAWVGSVPVRFERPKTTIPVAAPRLASSSAVAPYLTAMHESGVFTNYGPLVQALESRYAELLGVDPARVVATSSGTQALTSLVFVMDATKWLVPDWTFAASGLAVLQAGKELALADIDPETWSLADHPKQSSMGLLMVAPFGGKVRTEVLPAGMNVIVDAAASLGRLESLSGLDAGHAVMYSLHATKTLGTAEGGLAVCGSSELAEKVRMYINFGFWGERISQVRATNAKMSELHAAYALAALDGWDQEHRDWQRAHTGAREISNRLSLTSGPVTLDGVTPYWVIDLRTSSRRERVEQVLNSEHIGTRRWWPSPLSSMPTFAHLEAGPFASATSLSARVLGLPCYRDMTEETFEHIEAGLEKALS